MMDVETGHQDRDREHVQAALARTDWLSALAQARIKHGNSAQVVSQHRHRLG